MTSVCDAPLGQTWDMPGLVYWLKLYDIYFQGVFLVYCFNDNTKPCIISLSIK